MYRVLRDTYMYNYYINEFLRKFRKCQKGTASTGILALSQFEPELKGEPGFDFYDFSMKK